MLNGDCGLNNRKFKIMISVAKLIIALLRSVSFHQINCSNIDMQCKLSSFLNVLNSNYIKQEMIRNPTRSIFFQMFFSTSSFSISAVLIIYTEFVIAKIPQMTESYFD